ncbi:MAG: thioredoxin family protein [candidate division WOR-3 bacterium]
MKSLIINFISFIIIISFFSCTPNENVRSSTESVPEKLSFGNYKITFIEIGSTTCIPCQMMQPIMKEIKDSFPNDVQVVFYDLNNRENLKYAQKYSVRVIPTQIFIDNKGEIIFKHQGFFPKDEIFEFLKSKGVKK